MAVHLSVRSHYSLLNGTMSVEELVVAAKERGYTQIALTEHKVMFSTLNFFKAASKHNIKPIIGLEIELNDHTYSELLARDYEGLQVLYQLSYQMSQGNVISLEDFAPFMDHLVFILYCEGGPLEPLFLKNEWDSIQDKLLHIKHTIPKFYLGLSHQESRFFQDVNQRLRLVALENEVECVALPKVLYKNNGDQQLLRALQAIDKSTYIDDSSLNLHLGRWLITREEMNNLYDAELVEVSNRIADLCDVNVLERKATLPHFKNNQNLANDQFLNQLSLAGLKRRLRDVVPREYHERLKFELNTINSMSFTDYFLIVYDVIRYAKLKGINVGPGRGSSAGSLVAYSLGITEVDPIKYGLMFERFLNPERITMPDIDIDIPDNKRDEVIEYVKYKYGMDHVGHIVTFGTLKAKQSFRDASRVLQVPISKVNQVARLLGNLDLASSFDSNSKLRTLINSDSKLSNAFELAKRLENIPRHVSTHAGGIVLTSRPLLEYCPLYRIDDTTTCVQYDMNYLESIGLIKIDFLGIRNLSIIANIVQEIQKNHPEFNIKALPLDDVKTFELLSRAETLGIFQLESEGMKNLLKRLKPKRFLDIVDAIALFRPGPMENIPTYLSNRLQPNKIVYLHNDLKSITESTYGVLIYQEQIMEVARVFGGFSLARADILRRAMSKKNATLLEGLRSEFIQGARNNGYDVTLAEEIYDLIYRFANYGFNKSHSVVYSVVSYQLAYLKANYPNIFYTYILTSVIGSESKTGQYIDECRRRSITILPIDLNMSEVVYNHNSDGIRLPFTLIKGISISSAQQIVAERDAFGVYTSIYDAIARLCLLKINRRQLDSLVDVGAFDTLFSNRAILRANMDALIQYADLVRVQNSEIRFDFSLVSEPTLKNAHEKPTARLNREVEHLGFYLSEHPVQALRVKHNLKSIAYALTQKSNVRIVAVVDRIKTHRTKKGTMMAFLSISDDTAIIDAVCFPNIYDTIENELVRGDIILAMGLVKEDASFVINELRILRDPNDLLIEQTHDINEL